MDPHVFLWPLFAVVVVTALAVDLGLKSHRDRVEGVSLREALHWSVAWVVLSLLFGIVVHFAMGRQRALEFLTAYLIEKALSVDNMFVFVMIFQFFAIAPRYQARVLKWGILGALVMRFILIFAGVALLQRFHWLLYVFGALLIFTAFRMLVQSESDVHPEKNPLLRLFSRYMPVVHELHGQDFFLRREAGWAATPLFATLLVIEASDLMFAMDSIPAVLAISKDPFIIFTSNVFAILGLRALYFLISGVMGLFRFLHYGLAAILAFVGTKMLLSHFYHVPVAWSLLVVAVVLLISILASLAYPEQATPEARD